jgi:hypothetical protein
MTVRIETSTENSKTIVFLSGRLADLGVGEFLKTCRLVQGELVLDLSDLCSVDPEGIKAIKKLVGGGAKLRGVAPFIRILLEVQEPAMAD